MISYQDLDLRVRADGDGFVVEARRGTQTASEPFQLDLSQSWDLWYPEERTPREAEAVGAALFDALIHGRVRNLYHQGYGGAGGDASKGLRLRILLDPRDKRLRPLLGLPWEALFDRSADIDKLLALDPRRPVVRALDTIQQTLTPSPGKLERVLLAYAKPERVAWIDADVECENVEEVLLRRSLCPNVLRRVTYRDLADGVADFRPQIVHFMGHGTFDSAEGEGAMPHEMNDLGPEVSDAVRKVPIGDSSQHVRAEGASQENL
ncbi:MAG TPA: CHAT domain-containing protein, partial [Thermoanaerobaculia bacterium]|nr:CHAT domain-containing protein [Thermoanaerobaculia bacterium]